MQIDNKEFQKCKSGQEFKAKFISQSGPEEPKPPRGMPRWFKVWTQTEFHSFEKRSDSRFDRIENRLDNIESRLTKVETDVGGVKAELTNVIKLNNLKH